MTLFQRLYDRMLKFAAHQHAPYYLAGVSFVESSIFPIPPDVMLIPMTLSKPLSAWQYAAITTLASIVGGIFGYCLGYYAFEFIGEPLIKAFGYEALYEQAISWFKAYGFVAVLIAGFTPIPYKMFTLSAGATQMSLLPFIIASILGRGMRFFLVAGLVRFLGKKVEGAIKQYMDYIGWITITVIIIASLIYYYV